MLKKEHKFQWRSYWERRIEGPHRLNKLFGRKRSTLRFPNAKIK